MAGSTDAQCTSSHILVQKSSMAHPSRSKITPGLAVLAFMTLHHLGPISQNFCLGIRCLRPHGECSAPFCTLSFLLISLPGSPFTSIFVGQILPSIKGTAGRCLDSLSVVSNHNFPTSWRNLQHLQSLPSASLDAVSALNPSRVCMSCFCTTSL